MNGSDAPMVREYVGTIYVGDNQGLDFRVSARSLEEAQALVVEKHGGAHMISIWNEDDAAKLR